MKSFKNIMDDSKDNRVQKLIGKKGVLNELDAALQINPLGWERIDD